ncbi:MAG: acyl transferase [Bacteroidota bacterium]
MKLIDRIFGISSEDDFRFCAFELLRKQYEEVGIYRRYVDGIGCEIDRVSDLLQTPYLPISFFKECDVISEHFAPQQIFRSSRTSGQRPSSHLVADLSIYDRSLSEGFIRNFGAPTDFTLLALLPSYLERDDASLVYMTRRLMEHSGDPLNGFFLNDHEALDARIRLLLDSGKRFMLFGVPFALLDLLEKYRYEFGDNILVETGGMKGRRRELVREELHGLLCDGFGVKKVYSEYGMTELLSQAWSNGDGLYRPVPWMRTIAFDTNDPFHPLPPGQTGVLHVIDLANVHSCSFIATEDIGRVFADGTFEVLGRIDNSDIRGCNLLAGA